MLWLQPKQKASAAPAVNKKGRKRTPLTPTEATSLHLFKVCLSGPVPSPWLPCKSTSRPSTTAAFLSIENFLASCLCRFPSEEEEDSSKYKVVEVTKDQLPKDKEMEQIVEELASEPEEELLDIQKASLFNRFMEEGLLELPEPTEEEPPIFSINVRSITGRSRLQTVISFYPHRAEISTCCRNVLCLLPDPTTIWPGQYHLPSYWSGGGSTSGVLYTWFSLGAGLWQIANCRWFLDGSATLAHQCICCPGRKQEFGAPSLSPLGL